MSESNPSSSISMELKIIAQTLDTITKRIAELERHAVGTSEMRSDALFKAKQHYKSRRAREKLFNTPDLFGEPAWDMLVDLFIAAEEGKQISVSSLCVASAVPMTTALRWIGILESRNMIERTADDCDARRFYLALSSSAQAKIRDHFESVTR